MQISSTGPAVVPQLPASGKSKALPPGLASRDFDLPPGIEKKLASGGTAPPGISKRFPAATTPPTVPPESSSGAETPPTSETTPAALTSSVDLVI